jgi:hypothetical protein
MPSVLELFFNPPADYETVVLRDGHRAPIEEAVDVAAQQQSIRDLVIAAFRIGSDVRGI